MTNETVSNPGEQIGTIKKFSSNEASKIPNLFSNKYKKGTRLFEIEGLDRGEAIAVEVEDHKFIKAIRQIGMKTAD